MLWWVMTGCVGGQIGGPVWNADPEEEEEEETGEPDAGETGDTDTGGDSGGGDTAPEVPPDTRPAGSCEAVIPPEAVVIDRDRDDTTDDLLAWICRGATVSASGTRGAWFVDEGGELVVTGPEGRAWVHASASIAVFAGPTEVWAEEGADVRVEAEEVVVNWCPSLPFSGGPEAGC
jgi:hypothetical protein